MNAKFGESLVRDCGISAPRPLDKQGVACSAGLTGEFYRAATKDPQESTNVQRSWLYTNDAAVKAHEQGPKVSQQLTKDNETSLPIGMGEREHFKVSTEPGFYRHHRSEITMVRNKVLTQK